MTGIIGRRRHVLLGNSVHTPRQLGITRADDRRRRRAIPTVVKSFFLWNPSYLRLMQLFRLGEIFHRTRLKRMNWLPCSSLPFIIKPSCLLLASGAKLFPGFNKLCAGAPGLAVVLIHKIDGGGWINEEEHRLLRPFLPDSSSCVKV